MAQPQVTTGRCWQVAGWSSLIVGALLLAALFNAGVTSGVRGAQPTDIFSARVTPHAPSIQSGIHEGTNRTLSPATAALADGDDVRARLLVGRPELASFLVSRPDP